MATRYTDDTSRETLCATIDLLDQQNRDLEAKCARLEAELDGYKNGKKPAEPQETPQDMFEIAEHGKPSGAKTHAQEERELSERLLKMAGVSPSTSPEPSEDDEEKSRAYCDEEARRQADVKRRMRSTNILGRFGISTRGSSYGGKAV